MRGERYSIDALVSIKAPYGEKVAPDITAAELRPFLRSLTVTHTLNAPGTFTIELAPRKYGSFDASLAEVIRERSLVSIAIHRDSASRDRSCTREPEPVLVGVVDAVNYSESWQSKDPVRRIEIRGHELSYLLVDHKWWFHNWLASSGVLQLPADMRDYVPMQDVQMLRDEQGLRELGFLAINENLFDPAERTPVRLMDAAFHFFVRSMPPVEPAPFIKLLFSDGRPLSERLRFDADSAETAFFDPSARLVSKFLPTSMPQASCWELMRFFCEDPFTEMFSDTFGPNLDDAHCQVVARKPPWQGWIEDGQRVAMPEFTPRTSWTKTATPRGFSLFDVEWGEGDWRWDRPQMTETINRSDVLSVQAMRRGIEEQCFSLYQVTPNIFVNSGDGVGNVVWEQFIPPIIDEDELSPGYIQRIGLRPLRKKSRYIPVLDELDATRLADGDVSSHCLAYAGLLREWFHRIPAFWHGTLHLKGRTGFRVGRRLLDEGRPREYYITSVTHRVDLGSLQPSFTSTVAVERGWDLLPGVA